jgi:hypothetical protein
MSAVIPELREAQYTGPRSRDVSAMHVDLCPGSLRVRAPAWMTIGITP